MLSFILSALFPSHPYQQRTTPTLAGLLPVRLSQNDLRKRGITSLDGLTAAAHYAESKDLQDVIWRFKYKRERALSPALDRLLADAFMLCAPIEKTVLCPVPLHWSRRFARGFNQAEVLARGLARIHGLTVLPCVRRTRPTGHQAWRTHDERKRAMHNAFVATGSPPLHVTLVDDVATTMSTLDACARALKDAGVLHVDAIVIALG